MKLLRISEQAARVWGYFDSPGQRDYPMHDPGLTSCPICDHMVTMDDVRTITVMYTKGRALACFYRVHRTCHDALSQSEREAVESHLMDLLPIPVALGDG